MKIVKIILISLIAIVALLLTIPLFMDSHMEVKKSIEIDAPIETVFDQVNDFKNWDNWLPWNKLDSNMKKTYSDITAGVGAKYAWESEHEDVQVGEITIVKSEIPFLIGYEMSFAGSDPAGGTYTFTEKNGIVTATWAFKSELPYYMRMMKPMIESMLDVMFEQGLNDLKTFSELQPKVTIDISVTEIASTKIIYVEEAADFTKDNIAQIMGKAYGELMGFLKKNNLKMNKPPLSITTKFEGSTKAFNIALPFEGTMPKLEGRIKEGVTYAGKVVKAVHVGPYDSLGKTYQAIQKYLISNNLEVADKSWEEYVNDPTQVKPEELLTNIYFPIK